MKISGERVDISEEGFFLIFFSIFGASLDLCYGACASCSVWASLVVECRLFYLVVWASLGLL